MDGFFDLAHYVESHFKVARQQVSKSKKKIVT